MAQETTHATVFVTDAGFLMPSIYAALQVIEQTNDRIRTDVFIAIMQATDEDVAALGSTFGARGLRFLSIDANQFDLGPAMELGDTHISPASFGRLFLHDILPPQYRDILYLDGDVQIVGDISELLSLRLGSGQVAAALDSIWMYERTRSDYGRLTQTYRNRLRHLTGPQYSNSGVMAFNRETWREVGPRAWRFFLDNKNDCLFHDQSALNAVLGGDVSWLSPAYNFNTDYRLMGFGGLVSPRILHFTGPMKPWLMTTGPWSGQPVKRYSRFLRQHPELHRFVKMPQKERQRSLRNQWIVGMWNGTPGVSDPQNFLTRWRTFRKMMRETNFILK